MPKQLQHPDYVLAVFFRLAMMQKPLPAYELGRLFADLRVRHLVGELIARAARAAHGRLA
jgi:hypothetical protein